MKFFECDIYTKLREEMIITFRWTGKKNASALVLEIKVGKNIMLLSLWLQWRDKNPAEPRKVVGRLESPLNINIHITPTRTPHSRFSCFHTCTDKSIRFYYLAMGNF